MMDNKKIRLAVGALAVSAATLVGIATHEGYRSEAYKDAVGIPTLGFGETAGVKMGDKTTPERALVQLLESTEKHADAIRQCIHVPLYQHEFDAYISLAYNIGTGAFASSSVARYIRRGEYRAAADAFGMWIYAGKQKLPGLVTRRQREKEVFLRDGTE